MFIHHHISLTEPFLAASTSTAANAR